MNRRAIARSEISRTVLVLMKALVAGDDEAQSVVELQGDQHGHDFAEHVTSSDCHPEDRRPEGSSLRSG
jgi:hypothetical protein